MGALPGALSAVLVPAPLLLSEEMKSVLAAAPSARLDAWIESGGRHPGQAAAEAVALEDAMLTVTAATLALESAATDAELAFEALVHALQRDSETAVSDSDHAADVPFADAPLPPPPQTGRIADDIIASDVLTGISTAVLLKEYRNTTWGQWIAMTGCLSRALAREAQLRRAICDAILNAPPPGASGGTWSSRSGDAVEEALSVDMCDAFAQLWRLQPHVDDSMLKCMVDATLGE